MFINRDTPEAEKYRVHDCTGAVLQFVQSYDTETQEVSLCLGSVRSDKDGKAEQANILVSTDPPRDEQGNWRFTPVMVKFVLRGSFATHDGEIVPPGELHEAFRPVVMHATVGGEAAVSGEASVDAAPQAELEIKSA